MLSSVFAVVQQLDLGSFFVMFWHMVIFELPRFFVSAIVVGGIKAMERRNINRTPPDLTISVLMPGHNEGAALRRTVLGLHEQTRRVNQIVIVDDGSTDDMAAVARRLRAEGLIDVFLKTGLRGGKSAAANLGLASCSGDIVIIADIDTSFDRDALERIIEPFAVPAVGAVSGNIGVRNTERSVLARFQAVQYLLSISLGRRVSDLLNVVFIASGAFAAFRREALISIGGWEVGPGEDADLTVKLRRAGWKVRFQPDAWALTDVPETMVGLTRQRLRWNRTLIRVRVRKFRRMFSPSWRNFSLIDALGTLDILCFQGLLPASFFIYVLWMFAYYGSFGWVVLASVSLIYVLTSLISFFVAISVSDHYGRIGLLPYVPGYALFNAYVLRAISVYAYLDELIFRRSYKDSYVPRRVLKQAELWQ